MMRPLRLATKSGKTRGTRRRAKTGEVSATTTLNQKAKIGAEYLHVQHLPAVRHSGGGSANCPRCELATESQCPNGIKKKSLRLPRIAHDKEDEKKRGQGIRT